MAETEEKEIFVPYNADPAEKAKKLKGKVVIQRIRTGEGTLYTVVDHPSSSGRSRSPKTQEEPAPAPPASSISEEEEEEEEESDEEEEEEDEPDLNDYTVKELLEIAREEGARFKTKKKANLIRAIRKVRKENG